MSGSATPKWPAFWALVRELGLARALSVGWRLEGETRRGEPFLALPPPADERERLSRAQAGPAILLYRELRRRLDEAEALRIAERVVKASGVRFMRKMLGPLTQQRIAEMDSAARQDFVSTKSERFFNAEIRWERVEPEEVRFVVTACRFPALCEAAGAPELAPLFCRVDEAYFGNVEPNVVLERATTIAEGGSSCPFSLRWDSSEGLS